MAGHRVAVDVGVDDADLEPLRGHREREVDGDRRLADAALAGGDREHLGQRAGLGERDLPLGLAAAQRLLQRRRAARRSSRRASTSTPVTPATAPTAAVTSRVMVSFIGQPDDRQQDRDRDRRRPSATSTDSTMPRSVIGRWISGSLTVASAAWTCSRSGGAHDASRRTWAAGRPSATRRRARSRSVVAVLVGLAPRLVELARAASAARSAGSRGSRPRRAPSAARPPRGPGTPCPRAPGRWPARSCSAMTRSRSAWRFCASRISGAAYDACRLSIRVRKMNGYSSKRRSSGRERCSSRPRRRRTASCRRGTARCP